MKKAVLMVLISILVFWGSFLTVHASTDEILIRETTKYFESKSSDKGFLQKEITEKEANMTIEFKKIMKELKKRNNQSNSDDNFELSVAAINVIEDLDDGGGSGGTSLIVYPITGSENTTTVHCNLETFVFCEGIAETMGTITKLVTTSWLNPNAKTAMHVKNELTWYDSPQNNFTDYMAIAYDSSNLEPVLTSIKAKTQVYFDSYELNDINHVIPYSHYFAETLLYQGEDKVINFSLNGSGIVWNILKVYTDYDQYNLYTNDAVLHTESGGTYQDVEVNKVIYTLETDLSLKNLNAYKDMNITTIWGDYRHTYFYISVVPTSFVLNGYIIGSNPVISYLNVTITLTIRPDGSRQNDIQFIF